MMVSVKCGRSPIEKARDRFPGAGFLIFAMLNICRWFARHVKSWQHEIQTTLLANCATRGSRPI